MLKSRNIALLAVSLVVGMVFVANVVQSEERTDAAEEQKSLTRPVTVTVAIRREGIEEALLLGPLSMTRECQIGTELHRPEVEVHVQCHRQDDGRVHVHYSAKMESVEEDGFAAEASGATTVSLDSELQLVQIRDLVVTLSVEK